MTERDFPNLKELSLSMCNLEILNVFRDVETLNSVMISSSKEDIIREFIRIMIAKKHMKHIHIKSPAKLLKFAMEQAEQELFKSQKLERPNKSLQIIFDGNNWDDNIILLNELHLTIFRLLNALEKSAMRDFILRVKITSKQKIIINKNNKDIEKWLGVLQDYKDKYLIHYEFTTKKSIETFIFTISNKMCKVNGYRYSWKMWSSSL